MEKSMDELYQEAKRFDEGELYQSDEYQNVAVRQVKLYREMRTLFGRTFAVLMEDYNTALAEEMELERRHFFEQGYLMGQGSASGQEEENRV